MCGSPATCRAVLPAVNVGTDLSRSHRPGQPDAYRPASLPGRAAPPPTTPSCWPANWPPTPSRTPRADSQAVPSPSASTSTAAASTPRWKTRAAPGTARSAPGDPRTASTCSAACPPPAAPGTASTGGSSGSPSARARHHSNDHPEHRAHRRASDLNHRHRTRRTSRRLTLGPAPTSSTPMPTCAPPSTCSSKLPNKQTHRLPETPALPENDRSGQALVSGAIDVMPCNRSSRQAMSPASSCARA